MRVNVALGRRRVLRLLPLVLALALPAAQADPGALRIYAMESKPISFMDNGRASGLVVELAEQVQGRLPPQFARQQVEIVPWARANSLALRGPNILLLSIVRTPERERYLSFVGPLFVAYISAYAVRGRAEELRQLGDGVRQLRAGARRGSIFVELARKAGYNVTDETNSSETAARMLMQRRFDLWFDGEEIVEPALQLAGYQRHDVEKVLRLSEHEVYFAFSAGTPEATIEAWEGALRELKRDGAYQKIHRKWLPGYPLLPDTRRYGLKAH